jgi:hypothetical protein
VALWVGDWYVDAAGVVQIAPYVDAVLVDAAGAVPLRAAGVPNVVECTPWVFDPAAIFPAWDEEPLYDVSFVGSLHDAIHLERNRWLDRLLRLPDGWRVRVDGGLWGDPYGELLRRSRIGFNFCVTEGVNMRCFESPASGSLLFVERSNREIGKWLRDGEECVLYGEDDFEDLLEHYLADEAERRRVAEAGWRRVQDLAPSVVAPGLLERLAEVARRGVVRARPPRADAARVSAYQALHMAAGERPYAELELLLEDAEQDAPADVGLLVNRAVMYVLCARELPEEQRAGAIEGAVDYLRRAVAADSADAVALLDQATLLAMVGATGPAADVLRRLLALLDEDRAVIRHDRLMLRHTIDDFTMAWAEGWLRHGPAGGPDALRGVLAAEVAERLAALSGDAAERERLLRRAIAAKAAPVDARRRLLLDLANAGDLEGALEQAELALADKPLLDALWDERVALLLALDRHDEAAETVARATAIAERMPRRRPLAERLAGRLAAVARPVRPV